MRKPPLPQNKVVWVTGARGFIGRHLSMQLSQQGNTVLGLGHGAWPAELSKKWGLNFWINGDINSQNLKRLELEFGKPTSIYHLAGGSSVGSSFVNPLEDYNRTVSSSAALLDWIRTESPSTQLICTSSAAVYGQGHHHSIKETTTLLPYSPYGGHKAMMEMLCQNYVDSFDLRVSVVRLFSVYGAGLKKQLLWDICVKLANGTNPINLGGTGNEIRDWIHVTDAARLLIIAEKTNPGGFHILNGGTGVKTSVNQIAQNVIAAWGGRSEVQFTGKSRPGDPNCLLADTSRITQFGYLPSIQLETGLPEAVAWYKNYLDF